MLRDAAGKGSSRPVAAGGYSGDLGVELEGPGKRAETSQDRRGDLPPGCLVPCGKSGSSRL